MSDIEIRDLTGPIGAEVIGFDPASGVDAETGDRLRRTFDERGVVVFRDVDLDVRTQGMLCEILGAMELTGSDAEDVEIEPANYVSNEVPGATAPFGRLHFHTEAMWSDEYILVLSLYATHVESPATPTILASATRAYDVLPSDLKARIEGLEIVHTAGQRPRPGDGDDLLVATPELPKSRTTPIAMPHPRTGKTLLYLAEQVSHEIVGLPPEEGHELIESLFDVLYAPENIYSHEWQPKDLVIVDNLSIQHARPNVVADGPPRTLRKVVRPAGTISRPDRAFGYEAVK
jgi:taurine dioxygenase